MDLINAEVADNYEIRGILNALIDKLCCTNNAQVVSTEECPLNADSEDKLSGSKLEQIMTEKTGTIVLEPVCCNKNEDNISCHSDDSSSFHESISKNQNEDDVADVRSEIEYVNEKSVLTIVSVSKNPFDDSDDASPNSPNTTGNPFDETTITSNLPVVIKAKTKSFIIRSQPPQANAIPCNVGQQRYKTTTASTGPGSKFVGDTNATSYPKTLFAARPGKVEISPPPSSTSSSLRSSISYRPSVSVAASSPPRRISSIAFVAPKESIPEISPTVLTYEFYCFLVVPSLLYPFSKMLT